MIVYNVGKSNARQNAYTYLYLYKALGINANVVLGYTVYLQVTCCKLVPCQSNCSIQLGDLLCILDKAVHLG